MLVTAIPPLAGEAGCLRFDAGYWILADRFFNFGFRFFNLGFPVSDFGFFKFGF
jgi:hypothetical protein